MWTIRRNLTPSPFLVLGCGARNDHLHPTAITVGRDLSLDPDIHADPRDRVSNRKLEGKFSCILCEDLPSEYFVDPRLWENFRYLGHRSGGVLIFSSELASFTHALSGYAQLNGWLCLVNPPAMEWPALWLDHPGIADYIRDRQRYRCQCMVLLR